MHPTTPLTLVTRTPRTDYASILRTYTTKDAARILRVKPQTLRRALCVRGEYYGITPRKMPNGRLLWDADSIDALVRGEG